MAMVMAMSQPRFDVMRTRPLLEMRRLQSERAGVAVGENANELVVEVVRRLANVFRNSFVVHLSAAVDVFLQPFVKVLVLPSLLDLSFVVQLDLRDQQPS